MEKNIKRVVMRCAVKIVAPDPNMFIPVSKLSTIINTQKDIISICKKHNHDINGKYDRECTLLSTAIQKGFHKFSLLLIKYQKVDVNKTYGYYGPLAHSIKYKDNHILDALLSRAEIDVNHKFINDADSYLMCALKWNNLGAVKKLAKRSNSFIKKEAFEVACRRYKSILIVHGHSFSFDRGVYLKRNLRSYYNMIQALVRYGATVDKKFIAEASMQDLFGHWKQWLPEWSTKTHKYYPKDFQKQVFTWLCCSSKRLGFYKDMRIEIVKYMAKIY